MQFLRTAVWVAIVAGLSFFAAFNWVDVDVLIWEDLVLTTKLPVLIFTAFLLGLIPMWMLHRATRWRLERRIASLETAQRTMAANRAAAEERTALDTNVTDSTP